MDAAQLVAYLNAIQVGDMDAIEGKLDQARKACLNLEQLELAESLEEASHALGGADLKTFRKRLQSVVSKLGHLK